MTLTVGGLHSNVVPVILPSLSKETVSLLSGSINGETYEPTLIMVSTGFNNFSSAFLWLTPEKFGNFTADISPGLYTVYSNRTHWGSSAVNIAVNDTRVEVNLVVFPLTINTGFVSVLASDNSEIYARFNLSALESCHINLKFPRCGGTRLMYEQHGEILVTTEISASYYLVYAKGSDFSRDFVAFYVKDKEFPVVRLQGKEGSSGIWVLYCISGRQGVRSLKVLDYYVMESEFREDEVCSEVYGNETWSDEEINKGQILVSLD